MLELLPGDENSSALDVNNRGSVVGFSDDPRGPTGGPQAFIWTGGKPRAPRYIETVFGVGYRFADPVGE